MSTLADEHPALADELPYRCFINDLVDLRDEGVLQGSWLVGPSPDISDDADLLRRSEQAAKSAMHLRTGDTLHILYQRKPAPAPIALDYAHPAAAMVMKELREKFVNKEHWITPTRLYLHHQYGAPIKNIIKATILGASGDERLGTHELLMQQAAGRFAAMTDALQGIVGLQPMSRLELFRSLLYHVTYRDIAVPLPDPEARLNQVIACDWQINGTAPQIGEWHLRPIVITIYPHMNLPQMLACVLEHPGYLDLSIRYRAMTPFDAQSQIEKDKTYFQISSIGNFSNLLKSIFGYAQSHNEDSEKQVQELRRATALSQAGKSFGVVTAVVLVRDKDPRLANLRAHNLMGVLNGKGILARIETHGAAKAIMSTWPGRIITRTIEYEALRYKLKLSSQNYWDVSLPATYWEGIPTIQHPQFPPDTPTPFVCSGTSGTPFHLPTHVNGVGHFLGIGTTGSGKSTFINAYICALLAISNARIVLMDSSIAHSSYVFSQLIGAEYYDVGTKDSLPLCPLAHLDKEGGLQWLAGWFERLFFRRREFELDERESRDLLDAMQDVRMRKNPATAQGRNLLDLHNAISGGDRGGRDRMRKIIEEIMSYYNHILGGDPVETASSRVTVYHLSRLNDVPKYISTPAKELILHNIIASLDNAPTWVIWDEFWDAVGDDTSANWLFSSLRTMRGLNCSFGGFTQNSTEITQSKHCNVLLGNMPNLLFFPDASAANSYIAQSLMKVGQLNEHEISRIAGASPGQFYYKSAAGSRLASAWLGPVGQAICAATSYQDVAQARQILRQYNGDDFLQHWLRARSLAIAPEATATDGRRSRAG